MRLTVSHPRFNLNNDQSSLISVPIPEENCICIPRNRFKRRKPNRGEESNYEEEFIRQAMERMTLKEQESAEAVVRGDSDTAKIILERQNKGNGFVEEPAFLSLKFKELEQNLRARAATEQPGSKAYEMARSQDSSYIDRPDFKIGFLRAERYDAQKAARRMFQYFTEILDMFGPKSLARDILWEDLGADGQWYHIHGGGFQLLPKRDKAGRLVVFHGENLDGKIPPDKIHGIKKAIFYFMATLGDHDDEMGRVKGVSVVLWRVHKQPPLNTKLLLDLYRMRDSVPVKISAYHHCHLNRVLEVANQYANVLLPAITNAGIIRYYKTHFGTEQECKYKLLGYGIPVDTFPLQDDSNDIRPFHLREVPKWVAKRMQFDATREQLRRKLTSGRSPPLLTVDHLVHMLVDGESASMECLFDGSEHSFSSEDLLCESVASFEVDGMSIQGVGDNENVSDNKIEVREGDGTAKRIAETAGTIISEPDISPEDVLMGRSRKLREHKGNKFCRDLTSKYYESYYSINTEKEDKTKIATLIVQLVNSSGGRFLKQVTTTANETVWVVAEEREARDKVSNNFRNITRKKKEELEKQSKTNRKHTFP